MNRVMGKCMRTVTTGAIVMIALLAAMPRFARAADWSIDTKINFVEGTYIPDFMYFWVKTPTPASAGCSRDASGTILVFRALGVATTSDKKENVKAVYASLVNAAAVGANVRIAGFNRTPDDHCNVQLIYFSHR